MSEFENGWSTLKMEDRDSTLIFTIAEKRGGHIPFHVMGRANAERLVREVSDWLASHPEEKGEGVVE